LVQQLADGRVRFAYGGQFGDEPNDGNFVADGLVHADLTPHPAMREVAWVHRPVTVERVRGGLRVSGRHHRLHSVLAPQGEKL
ncbi:MAG TPA: glycoside hydrolase family 2 TIM barrel-domain containing protein, partial [Candidatus Deferrimicrobium sp.]|nr:glycoside hydrolase family 2 TIM barrel-domain containing protein [Candidatus Deferrimicrobium sp.]